MRPLRVRILFRPSLQTIFSRQKEGLLQALLVRQQTSASADSATALWKVIFSFFFQSAREAVCLILERKSRGLSASPARARKTRRSPLAVAPAFLPPSFRRRASAVERVPSWRTCINNNDDDVRQGVMRLVTKCLLFCSPSLPKSSLLQLLLPGTTAVVAAASVSASLQTQWSLLLARGNAPREEAWEGLRVSKVSAMASVSFLRGVASAALLHCSVWQKRNQRRRSSRRNLGAYETVDLSEFLLMQLLQCLRVDPGRHLEASLLLSFLNPGMQGRSRESRGDSASLLWIVLHLSSSACVSSEDADALRSPAVCRGA